MRVVWLVRAAALATAASALTAASAPQWEWSLPQGRPAPAVPAENPMSAAKVELGRRLFYDADLSIDGTMACAACHEQKHGFADGNRTRPGVHGDPGRRNVPGLANVAWRRTLTWADPGMRTLERQATVPITGDRPVEMGMKGAEGELSRRLGADPCYRRMFAAAFPREHGRIDLATVTAALAAFQRTLLSSGAPYDRWRRGEHGAMPGTAEAGARIFARHCSACHGGDDLTDDRFHRVDAAPFDPGDRGLAEITGDPGDEGKFRTPGLRNVAVSAPYFHDGAAPDLPQAIRRHSQLRLDDRDIAALTGFLAQLTDEAFLTDPRFAFPDNACAAKQAEKDGL